MVEAELSFATPSIFFFSSLRKKISTDNESREGKKRSSVFLIGYYCSILFTACGCKQQDYYAARRDGTG